MLITEKLPQGHIYPQITQAPINYFDFLNFFRGGHTIDDNLGATSIASTLQASLLGAAIKSGHLRKTKNMAMPNESLADIFLTELGAEQLATPQNGQQLMPGKKSEWERVKKEPLGEGGQSKVYLVRTPERTKERKQSREAITNHVWVSASTSESALQKSRMEYVEAIQTYSRGDKPEELGAMKEFKIRDDEKQSLDRLKQEIEVLQQNRPGLPKLLGFDIEERWMVTEYFPNGTLEDHIEEYTGNAALALKAFRSVVATIALLHNEKIVHRDIKPANIFIGKEHEFVLGDFGLVYVPNREARITRLHGETVGAGDFIPPATWRGMGARLETVKTDFDVYMLGKVLWCMVAGKPKLDREFWDEPENDLTKLFPSDPHMHMINLILGRSVVTREASCCGSANDLLLQVDTNLEQIRQGGQLLHEGIRRICHVCGAGQYSQQVLKDTPSYNMRLWNSGELHFTLLTWGLRFGSAIPAITASFSALACFPELEGFPVAPLRVLITRKLSISYTA
jgi:serine/threonine protein kinase